MGARNDLNEIYMTGSIVVAVVAGAMAQSWVVFVVALCVMMGMYVYTAKIR